MVLTKGFIWLTVFVAFAACVYPSNPNITKTYRSITIVYEPLTTPENVTGYDIEVMLANPPSYFVSSSHLNLNTYPNVTIDNLLLGETIKYRIGARVNHEEPKEGDYSPYYNVSTESSKLVPVPVIPGKPTNLKVVVNPDIESTHSVIVTWEDPINVQEAVNATDKDLQYKLDICLYNRFEPSKREGCRTYAQILRSKSTFNQSTLASRPGSFYPFNLHPDRNTELVYKITPTNLNGLAGIPAEYITRYNNTKAPTAPTLLNATNIHSNEMTLFWDQETNNNPKSYIGLINGSSVQVFRMAFSNPFTVTGLKNGTEYEFKVGTYTTENGGSAWSGSLKVSTTNKMKPTTPPSSNSNALTASFSITVLTSFVLLKMW